MVAGVQLLRHWILPEKLQHLKCIPQAVVPRRVTDAAKLTVTDENMIHTKTSCHTDKTEGPDKGAIHITALERHEKRSYGKEQLS